MKKNVLPFASLTLGPDSSAVSLDDALRNVETEPHASSIALCDLQEALQHGLQMVGADAGACVADGEPDRILDTLDTDDDLSACGCELEGVAEEVREAPGECAPDRRAKGTGRNDVGPQQNVARRGLRPERLDRFVYDPLRLSGLTADRKHAGVDARDIHQIADETSHETPDL